MKIADKYKVRELAGEHVVVVQGSITTWTKRRPAATPRRGPSGWRPAAYWKTADKTRDQSKGPRQKAPPEAEEGTTIRTKSGSTRAKAATEEK